MKDISAAGASVMKNSNVASQNSAEIKKAVINFEALFVNQMLQEMRKTIEKSGLLPAAPGEDIYESLFDAELSKLMASNGSIGLENILMKQLTNEFNAREDAPQPLNSAGADRGSNVVNPATTQNKTVEDKPVKAKKFRFPLRGKISSGYGLRKDPFTGGIKFHHGLDIAAPEGSPVYPASDGKVIFSGKRSGYGNVVEIMHDNGYVTRYAHNKENLVERGDSVTTADPIAYVGSTGRSTGPHLHFEVLKKGESVDPQALPFA